MNEAPTDLQLTPEFRTKPIRIVATAMEPIEIKHELNRIPAGWVLIDTTAPVNIWRSGVMDVNSLELTVDQDANITLVLL
jgi:hypothetical protein